MIETSFVTTAWSLLPPLLALSLALITRRVLLSLGAGVLVGSFLLHGAQPLAALSGVSDTALGLVYSDGATNSWNLQIIGFLLLLGAMTAVIAASGAAGAFAEWAAGRIRNRRGAQLLTALLGVLIFIDDYFNSLAVGSVGRPLTDRYQVSRAKLAYLLDSTAAPMCVLMPLSSWGAYIIALIGGILVSHGITDVTPMAAFTQMMPMNFYAVLALIAVLLVAWWDINLGPMASQEAAARNGQLFDPTKGTPAGEGLDSEPGVAGRSSGLLVPIAVLLVATIGWMLHTGNSALAADGQAFSLLGAFENTDVGLSLVWGAVCGLAVACVMALSGGVQLASLVKHLVSGVRSMLPAVWILLFAWALADVIGSLETGKFLAGQIGEHLSAQYLPALLFLLAGIMALATGTSWGTFGIMLPIAADMAVATEVSLMLPMLSAVLAGAVFGDHCSPISDTTILSSTGASCHHIDHVTTQLPYALLVAVISLGGYLVLGFTGSVMLGLGLGAVVLVAILAVLRSRQAAHSPSFA